MRPLNFKNPKKRLRPNSYKSWVQPHFKQLITSENFLFRSKFYQVSSKNLMKKVYRDSTFWINRYRRYVKFYKSKMPLRFPITLGFGSFVYWKGEDYDFARYFLLDQAMQKNHPKLDGYFKARRQGLIMVELVKYSQHLGIENIDMSREMEVRYRILRAEFVLTRILSRFAFWVLKSLVKEEFVKAVAGFWLL